MATSQPGARKLQILQSLAMMLENPKGEKITTAALAAKTQVSEAALYRHFASKAQMYEGLLDFIESSIFGLINQICAQQAEITLMLFNFAEQNPGMTRVLIGDALVNEDERLQARMNQTMERIELAYKQSMRQAAAQGQFQDSEIGNRAALFSSCVMGRWHRFVKSGFKYAPMQQAEAVIQLLLR
jgi:TetR/AcrR family transcriptional regulator